MGGVTLKNRIVLCAMGGTNPIGFEGKFSEGHRDYYIARAKANVGLMIPGVANVGSAGKGHRWNCGASSLLETSYPYIRGFLCCSHNLDQFIALQGRWYR